jgi:hypothetical protein
MARFILSLLRELDEKDTGEDWGIEADTTSGRNFGACADATLDNCEVDTDQEFLFLAAELEEDGGEDLAFEKDDEEMDEGAENDPGRNEDIDDNSSTPSNHNEDSSGKRYPILFTLEQKHALQCLYSGLRDNKPNGALLDLFHKVSLAVFTTQRADAERCRFHLPIDAFIIAFNLRKDGSIRKPVSIAPGVSTLQYWAQFAILYDAMKSQPRASIAEYDALFLLVFITCVNSLHLTDHYHTTRDGLALKRNARLQYSGTTSAFSGNRSRKPLHYPEYFFIRTLDPTSNLTVADLQLRRYLRCLLTYIIGRSDSYKKSFFSV